MAMRKVLFFVQGSIGGAEKITLRISNSLDKSKYSIKYVLFSMSNTNEFPLVSLLNDIDDIIKIPRLSTWRYVYTILRIIRKEKPDIVFSSSFFIAAKLLLLRHLFGKVKFIVRCEHNPSKFTERQRRILKFTYRYADTIIAQTEEMNSELRSVLGNKENIVTLTNPVSPTIKDKANEYNPYDNISSPVFVAVGRFNPVKGFDLLIKAFRHYIDLYRIGTLYIVGDYSGNNESYFEQVNNLVKKYELSAFVHFPGFKLNPYPFVKNANCFVLSSRSEGLPNVMLESLLLGTPVASFDCVPVINSIICEGVNGYTVNNGDIFALAEAMHLASKLGRVRPTFFTSTIEDFKKLF